MPNMFLSGRFCIVYLVGNKLWAFTLNQPVNLPCILTLISISPAFLSVSIPSSDAHTLAVFRCFSLSPNWPIDYSIKSRHALSPRVSYLIVAPSLAAVLTCLFSRCIST
ncbi:unnamed protein product [Sphacelaria rigidula]